MIDVIHKTQFDPSKLHGHIKMELFDAETKQLVQKVEKDNLVTNALKLILNDVAGGTPTSLSNIIMPVAERALGGLMLFSASLDADADNYFFPFGANQDSEYPYLIAGAGRGSDTTNPMAGSLNIAESGPNDRGYVSVWDFGTAQANGSIKAAALTQYSTAAGTIPFRSGLRNYSCHSIRRSDGQSGWGAQPLFYDTESKMLYFTSTDSSMGYSRTSSYSQGVTTYTYTMGIYATYLPLQEYRVADSIDMYKLPVFVRSISWNDTVAYNPQFLPAYDGYSYFTYAYENQEGNGVFKYLSLKTDDKSFTLSSMTTVTLTEAYLQSGIDSVRVTENFFWCVSYDKTGMYRVNRSNQAQVDLFSLPEDFQVADAGRCCQGGGINFVIHCPAANGQANYRDQYEALLYPDGNIVKNGTYFLRSNSIYTGGSEACTQVAYESAYLWNWGSRNGMSSVLGSAGVPSARYLATIANISTVEKNATQTLKVTYTLTDETGD